MAELTLENLMAIGSKADANEGGQEVLNVRAYQGKVLVMLNAKSSAGTSPTLDVKLQESDDPTLGTGYTTAGSTDNKLRDGANSNIKLAAKFTQDGDASVGSVALRLKKFGTISANKTLTVTIEADNAGDPSGTALATGTISTDDIDSDYANYKITLDKPVDLTDTSVYHVVLAGAYTESSTNCIGWRSNTVGSGGNLSFFDSAWAQTATESLEFYCEEYAFTDVTDGAFDQVTTSASLQSMYLEIDGLKPHLRAHTTVGGTSTPTFYAGVQIYGLKN